MLDPKGIPCTQNRTQNNEQIKVVTESKFHARKEGSNGRETHLYFLVVWPLERKLRQDPRRCGQRVSHAAAARQPQRAATRATAHAPRVYARTCEPLEPNEICLSQNGYENGFLNF